MEAKRVLIADDEPLIRRALSDFLGDRGYQADAAADGEEALAKVSASRYDLLLVDLRMPRVHGLDVISALAAEQPQLPMVVVSGTGILADAIEAIRRGAWDYITKPIVDMDEVVVVVERVLERARLIAERDHYQQELERLNRSLEAEVAGRTAILRAQNRRLTAMNQVAHAASSALELDTMLDRAIDAVLAAVDAEAGLVQILNPNTDCLYLAASRGFPSDVQPYREPLRVGTGVAGKVASDGHLLMGPMHDGEVDLGELASAAYAYYACVPLRTSDSAMYWDDERRSNRQPIVGTLSVFTHCEEPFSRDELELLTTVGSQLGVAVTRARYASDLQRANLQLEAANVELRRLDTLREQFIQNVAHELRTPLALVRGYVEMLVEGGLMPDQQERALMVTSERVRALVELVEAITTLQDLSAQPLDIQSVSPSALVRTACRMTQQRAVISGITLRCGEPVGIPAIPGDFGRITQALHQLLDNACKFSDPGTIVTLDTVLSDDGSHVVFRVRDQGAGIPEQECSRIFERFYQIDGSATRRHGGTGLGLALVKEIAEAHGGWVRVDSRTGEGSTFFLGLPRGVSPDPRRAAGVVP